jgi:hypothetical protein
MKRETYANVSWTPEDIATLRPEWTEEYCEEWLQRNERRISDRLVELGWDVIEILLSMGGE